MESLMQGIVRKIAADLDLNELGSVKKSQVKKNDADLESTQGRVVENAKNLLQQQYSEPNADTRI